MDVGLDLSWRIGRDRVVAFDARVFGLLRLIRDRGTLRAAAGEQGLSYRHAWGLLEQWAGILGTPLVILARGRGARLTAVGERLLWAEQRVGARLGPTLESMAAEIAAELAAVTAAPDGTAVRLFASHDLAIALLRELAGERLHLQLQYRGSLDSLRLLEAGRCEFAGFHVPSGALATRIAARYRPCLQSARDALVQIATRCQGLMVAPGNPLGIDGVRGLARKRARFVNRQPGSGTRLLLDALLEDAGIDPARIRGYTNEEFTHLAVAAMVASGAADAGFGIEAAAARFDLGFVPVAQERYLLAARRSALAQPASQALLAVLGGAVFRNRVDKLPGYDAAGSGTLLEVDAALPAARSGRRQRVSASSGTRGRRADRRG